MNIVANFFVLYIGFFLIALTILRQREQLLPQITTFPNALNWGLKISGWIILAIGMFFCVQQQGTGVGLTIWFGLLTASALLLSMLVLYIPKVALFLLPCALIISVFILF